MAENFDYGNARLRAMKAELFDERDYQELLAKDLDGLIASLAQTVYKVDIEAALMRARGRRCVQEAVRTHLARTLRKVASFYSGHPAQQIALLLARWDRRNLLTVLRAQAVPAPLRRDEDVLTLLVPAGRLDETDLTQLARQPDLHATVDLLAGWNIPDAETARTIRAAWPAYERSGDLAVLENAVNRAYALWLQHNVRWDKRVAPRAVAGNDLLRWVLCAEMDHLNLLIALRLREARQVGHHDWTSPSAGGAPGFQALEEGPFLPAGGLPFDLLTRLAAATREDALQALHTLPGAAYWQDALHAWQASGDLPALERDLEDQLTRAAISLFTRGDPLSIAVPIAFIWALENEGRNLRILAQGLAQQLDRAIMRDLLFVP